MNDAELFQKYLSGGAYALPYLLKFSCGSLEPVYLAGNNENLEYGGNTYPRPALSTLRRTFTEKARR